MKNFFAFMLFVIVIETKAQSVAEMELYRKVPNSINAANKEFTTVGNDNVIRVAKVSVPSLTMFKPAQQNGMSVIICPGGSYTILAWNKEGTKIADEFNKWGITAFFLR